MMYGANESMVQTKVPALRGIRRYPSPRSAPRPASTVQQISRSLQYGAAREYGAVRGCGTVRHHGVVASASSGIRVGCSGAPT